jgi:alkylation response protein AidB-like acyl-CoA dehydrogenase
MHDSVSVVRVNLPQVISNGCNSLRVHATSYSLGASQLLVLMMLHAHREQEHFCAQPLALFQQRHDATLDQLILLEKNMSFIDNCNDSVLSGM